MKLAFSNIAWDPAEDAPVLKRLSQAGFTGLEMAPTKLFGPQPYDCLTQAREYCRRLFEEYGMKVCSMQSLWYGKTGNIFQSAADRENLKDYTLRAIDFAAGIGCKNLVFGNPKARNKGDADTDIQVAEFFSRIAEYAWENGTCIALEPNPPIYGTDFINTTQDAFDYCRRLSDSHLKVNVDLGTMLWNGEAMDLIGENVKLVNHIHISEPYLKPIQPRQLHSQLKKLDYDGFVSVEMGMPESVQTVFGVIEYISEVLLGDG